MWRSLRTAAKVARRGSATALIFGTGYGVCWAQGREESADKLAVWGAAALFAATTRWLRWICHALPEAADWPRAQLEKVERSELRILDTLVARCRGQGLDSPILNQLLLSVLCAHAQGDAEGLAVQGLVAASTSSSARLPALELAHRIHEAAVASEGELPPADLLPTLSTALVSLLTELGSRDKVQEFVRYGGLASVGRSAAVATSWMAKAEAARQHVGRRMYLFTEEEEQQVTQDLCTVWKALRRSSEGIGIRDRWYLRAQLEGTEDRLPKNMRAAVEDASVALELGAVGPGKVGKLFDYLSWSALVIFLLAVFSDDGIGLLRFHLVPESLQQLVKERLQERALRVEELLTRHDPLAEDELIVAEVEPHGTWEPAEYLQGPLFRGGPG